MLATLPPCWWWMVVDHLRLAGVALVGRVRLCWRGAGWEGSPMLAWCWMGGFAYAGVVLVGRVRLCWRGAGVASWGWLGAGVAMRWSDFALLSKRTEAFG